MSYNAVPTQVTGDFWTAANNNTYIRDNFRAGIPDIFTAAGDIGYATAANSAINLPVGASHKRLVVNSDGTTPEWKGITGCGLSIAGNFKFSNSDSGTPNKIIWDTESFDTDGFWSDADPDAIIIPYDGIYQIAGRIFIVANPPDTGNFKLKIYLGPDDKKLYQNETWPNTSKTFNYVGHFSALDDVYLRVAFINNEQLKATGTTYTVRYLGAST